MRLFVVELEGEGSAGLYQTPEELEARMQHHWEGVPTIRALDQAVLAMVQTAHVGQVITWRMGWIFCAEDAQEPST